MIDKDCKVLSLNKSAAGILEREPEEIIGKSIFDLFPQEIATNYSKNLKEVFETGRPDFYDESRMIAEGRELWTNVSLSPVRDNKGNWA